MTKVRFVKDHGKHKKGSTAEVDDLRAQVWIKAGVAEKAKGAK